MTALSGPQSPLTDVEGDRRPRRRAGIIVALSTATVLATGGIIAVASQGAPAPAPAVPLASSTPTGNPPAPTTTLTPPTPTASVAPAIVTPTATPAATAPGTGTSTTSSAPAADNTTTTRATTTTTAPKTTTTTKAPTTKPTTATTTTKPTTTAPRSTATTKPPTTAPTTAPPKTLDACPNGDWSGNRYDGTCGTPPKPTASITACEMRTDAAGKRYAYIAAYVTDPGRVGYIATLHWSGKSQTFSRLIGSGPYSAKDYGLASVSGCSVTLG